MRLSKRSPAVRPRRRIRKRRLLALLAVVWLLASASFTFGLISAVAGEIPALDPEKQQGLELNGAIYASNGRSVLSVLRGSESRTLVKLGAVAPIMRQAIVDIEDQRFWEHSGIDIRGIGRALWADIRQQRVVEGGSTITQQFVKNAYVRNQRTIARKVREAALAWQLTQQWPRTRILEAYLNTIYFGNGAYGVQQASVTYFGHGASQLTLPQAALLAGIPRDPSLYDPVTRPQRARERRAVVLRTMLDQNDITLEDFRKANAAPLPRPEDVRLPGTEGPAQYFANYVKQQLIQKYGPARVFGDGLKVTTTIDLELQELARKSIAKWLTNPAGPSAALVALDPRDGAVKAMVGGNNYRESQFNLAVQAERQAGSAFKPFVLAAAMQRGIAPATRFVSEPKVYDLGGGKIWAPTNYGRSYLGNIDLTTATIHSDNAVYAQLTQLVGPRAIVETAHRLGIRSELNAYYAIGLGVEAVNPLELARAYAPFANGGRRVDGALTGNRPRVIESVENEKRGTSARNGVVEREVMAESHAEVLTSILQRVVREGTGKRAAIRGRPVAGKTGTTDDYADAWFVGYTPQLVVAVWVGYPPSPKSMLTEFRGESVSGGTFPALIWKSFVEEALKAGGEAPASFPAPPYLSATPKLVTRRLGRLLLDNGKCRFREEVVYYAGMGPSAVANCRLNEVEVPNLLGRTETDARVRLADQPLTPSLVYKPAKPRDPPWIVVDQFPKRGYLVSHSKVTLVVTKPVYGVIPNVVGMKLVTARKRLRGRKLEPVVSAFSRDAKPGVIVTQSPKAGLTAARGLVVKLVVGRG